MVSRDFGIDDSHVFAGPRATLGCRPAIDLQARVAPFFRSRMASIAA
jgi:hypothetical protein